MEKTNLNNSLLLSEFIDKYQREVSIICEDKTEQDTINNTFQNAYNCLLDFIENYYPDLELVITPLSTSLLGSYSKGIMIPDVPIGIIVNHNNNHYFDRQKNLLHNILCYIGIINISQDISLSGIIKNLSKNEPTRLYGYINFDGNQTSLHGLIKDENDEENVHSVNWRNANNSIVLEKEIQEIEAIYDNITNLLPDQYQRPLQFYHTDYKITPRHYKYIKDRIAKNYNLITKEKDRNNKEILICSSHRVLCEKTGLCTSYYFFNQPMIKQKGTGLYSNYGNIVITVNKTLTPVWEKILSFFSLQLLSAYRVYFQQKIESELLRSNQKSAKAAIMSRNMSHNLGSHVMSYLKMHLGSVSNILRDNVLYTLLESDDLSTLNNRTLDANKLTLPFLVGIGRFISYLQERQDFIATVSTDYVPYYSSVNFKDFIFDELNGDKRSERHPDRTNIKPDNILLGNIARSEGLGRQTSPTKENSRLCDIVLKFRTSFDGSPVRRTNIHKYHSNLQEFTTAKELDEMRSYEFSLPGGTVGRQAIFSIIENVIRNAAKHGNWRKHGKLELTIDIFSKEEVNVPNDSFLEERLWSDQATPDAFSLREVLQTFYCNEKEPTDDYYFLTLTDNLDCSQDSLVSLRKAIIEDYIDDEGRMINTNKGIKEMRISAAWLRSISDDIALSPFNESNVNEESEKNWPNNDNTLEIPPVLYVRRSKDKNQICHLQYIFCVLRPKKVAFISPQFRDYQRKNHHKASQFKKQSWDLLSPEDFVKQRNKNYETVIYDDTEINETRLENDKKERVNRVNRFNKVRRRSSNRFFKLSELPSEFTFIKELSLNNEHIQDRHIIKELNKAYVLLYEHLSKWDKNKDKKEKILIHDDKAKSSFQDEKQRTSDKITFNPEDDNIRYRYISHLEEKNNFLKYVINSASHFVFSEGISGDNSTDRLVRNEPKTKLWFYKHLHAMKQKVAIFDERIFSKVTGLDESDFISPEGFWGKDLNADKEYIKSKYDLREKDIEDIDFIYTTHEQLEQFMKNWENGQLELPDASDLNNVDAINHLGATYEYKRLNVFTLIRSIENPKRFNLFGIKVDKEKTALSQCVRYATLKWDSSNKRLHIDNDTQQKTDWMRFNTLSIHQGLLDKLYASFKIDKNDIVAKENLTKDFYEHFIIDATAQEIPFKDEKGEQHYYLPGMAIHSGRSKPSEEDMPQQLPFIPYSALEQAVLDCKYSIVELLDSARYE